MNPAGAMNFEATLHAFFDRKAVLGPAERAERKFLGKFGGYCRKTIQNSIRDGKDTSEVGHAPRNHPNGPFPGGYKATIFYSYVAADHAVYIGPVKLNQLSGRMEPNTLEFGGDALVRRGRRGQTRLEMCHFGARPHMRPGFARSIEQPQFRALLENCVINEAGTSAGFSSSQLAKVA